MVRKILILFLILNLCSLPVYADSTQKKSNKWTTIMTIIGAGGGFAAGMFIGLSAFDDAINSDKKVWTTVGVMSAAGGVAGFFIGRHMDKSRENLESRIMPEIRWQTQLPPPVAKKMQSTGMLRDADPIELLSRK